MTQVTRRSRISSFGGAALRPCDAGKLIAAACVLLLSAACVSPEAVHRRALEPETPGTGAMGASLTDIVEDGEFVGLHNSAQIDGRGLGKRARRLYMSELTVVKSSASDGVEIAVLAPKAAAAAVAERLATDDPEQAEAVLAAVREEIGEIWHEISDLPVESLRISFLAAPLSAGIWVYREERFEDGELHLLIGNGIESDFSLPLWLMRGINLAAHELLHVRQSSLGFRAARITQDQHVNKEAAAYLFGFCAQLRSFAALGATSGRLALNGSELRDLFPALDKGLLCPDRRALRRYRTIGKQGEMLSDAILYRVFGGADAALSESGQKRLLRICRVFARDVPNIVGGEIPTLQLTRVCRRR